MEQAPLSSQEAAIIASNSVLRISGPAINFLTMFNRLSAAIESARAAQLSELVFSQAPMSYLVDSSSGEVLNVFPTSA